MIKFSSSSKFNEIHIVDSPFQKYNFFLGGPNFGEGRPENLGTMDNNRDIYFYANRGVVNFEREYQPQPPGTKVLVMSQFSSMPNQILGKKNMKNLNFQAKI